jgi:hypothetical protein
MNVKEIIDYFSVAHGSLTTSIELPLKWHHFHTSSSIKPLHQYKSKTQNKGNVYLQSYLCYNHT